MNNLSDKNVIMDDQTRRHVECVALAEQAGPTKAQEPQEHILQFFEFTHLPPSLREASRPFHALAHSIVDNTPRNPERTVALRKLLEAKDAAVRAVIAK